MNFTWSQSALKDLEKETTCPARWKGQWIDKLFKGFTSEAADYGNYFEYLCIGGSAHGGPVTDLLRLANGGKSATQKRIEMQAALFNEMFDPLSKQFAGYTITGSQTILRGEIGDVYIEGVADIMALYKGEQIILDLKLTEDIDNVRTVYGWGNPTEDIDLLQQVLYQDLFKQMTGLLLPTHLLVFEHGPKMRVKIIRLNISENKRQECYERFITGSSVVYQYNETKWVRTPSEKECKSCGISECNKRFKQQQIIIEDINY